MPNKSINSIPLKLNLFHIKYLTLALKFSENRIKKIICNKDEIVKEKRIPKKSKNEYRLIQYPVGEYKILLKRLHRLLMNRANFYKSVCGGIIDKNLFDMVKQHCGKEAIFQVDLRNFFPNISTDRIYKFFRDTGCSEIISQLLTDLVSFEDKIPQGFPTSPIMANLIPWKMDYDHEAICKKHGLKSTRWIDDILVSGRIADLNKSIYKIKSSIKKNGFIINKKKTKFRRRSDKKKDMIAVGLDLWKNKPDVPTKVYEKTENMLMAFNEFGANIASEMFDEEFNSKDVKQSLKGKIRFIEEYNTKKGDYLRDLFDQVNWTA